MNIKSVLSFGLISGTGVGGGDSTDPGVENVLSGVLYTINGTEYSGTYSDLSFYSIDPGVDNVRLDIAYNIDGVDYVGTLVIPRLANVGRSGKPKEEKYIPKHKISRTDQTGKKNYEFSRETTKIIKKDPTGIIFDRF